MSSLFPYRQLERKLQYVRWLHRGREAPEEEDIVEEMTDTYIKGDYLEGFTQDGDDALMSPKSFAERFHNVCLGFGMQVW